MVDVKKLYSDINFLFEPNEEDQSAAKRLDLAFKYFYHINKGSKIINDSKALSALQFVLLHSETTNSTELSLKYDFCKILINILENIYQRLIDNLLKNLEESELNSQNKTGLLAIGVMVLNILENFLTNSSKFCISFQELNGLKTLFNFLNNRRLQESFIGTLRNKTDKEFYLIKIILRRILSSLSIISRESIEFRPKWKECNCVKNLLFYASRTKDLVIARINICLTIGNLCDGQDAKKFENEFKEIIPDLCRLVGIASKKIKIEKDIPRNDVCKVYFKEVSWSLIDILISLHNLALIDKFKSEIYFKNRLFKYLREIIRLGNQSETKYALDLLGQLCFDREVLVDILGDKEFYNFLKKVGSKKSKNIICLIENSISKEVLNFSAQKIFIIFNEQDEAICGKLKHELQKRNFKVLLADKIKDLGDSMKLLDESFCILAILSDKFERDFVCRAEVEYALKSNKTIIPLFAQEEFYSEVWLGKL